MSIKSPKRELPNYSYDSIAIDLSVARDGLLMSIAGNYIKAVEATDIDANINVALNDSSRDVINIKKGRSVSGRFFDIYLYNTAQAGKTITLVIADLTAITIEDDGVVGDIDTIQSLKELYLPTNFDAYERFGGEPVDFGAHASGVITTLYTVPTGKVVYIQNTGLSSQGQASAAGNFCIMSYDGSVYKALIIGGHNDGEPMATNINHNPMIELLEGDTLVSKNLGSSSMNVNSHFLSYSGFISV